MMYYSLDSVEENFVVMMDDNMISITVPKSTVLPTAKEGSVYVKKCEEFFEDTEETTRRKNINIALLKRIIR